MPAATDTFARIPVNAEQSPDQDSETRCRSQADLPALIMHVAGLQCPECSFVTHLPARRLQSRKCPAQAVQSSKQGSHRPADCEKDRYPHEDSSQDDDFFPRRDPGSFPAVKVRGFWGRAKDTLGFTAPEEADSTAVEFDPLRDGPLRYLGYANECG